MDAIVEARAKLEAEVACTGWVADEDALRKEILATADAYASAYLEAAMRGIEEPVDNCSCGARRIVDSLRERHKMLRARDPERRCDLCGHEDRLTALGDLAVCAPCLEYAAEIASPPKEAADAER